MIEYYTLATQVKRQLTGRDSVLERYRAGREGEDSG